MSTLSHGLNITKKPPIGQRPLPAKRKTIFDDESGPEDGPDEEEPSESISTIGGLQPTSKPKFSSNSKPQTKAAPSRSSKPPNISQYGDLSTQHTSTLHSKTAQKIDPSIYDYDAAYDSIHSTSLTNAPAADIQANKEKRPKYMTNLLAAAETRKRDQLRAKEKMLTKEREAEGDEFVDKEKFVTGAYKRQQEEMRRLEEEEREKERVDGERRGREGGGMTGFYRELLGRDQERHEFIVKAVEEGKGKEEGEAEAEAGKEGKSESEMAKEKGAMINEEGEVVDKRQLLSAGLNPGDGGKARGKVVDPREKRRETGKGGGRSSRGDTSRDFEEQLLGKRSASSEEEGGDTRAAKSRKMEDELLAAMGSP